ncbi:AP2-containing protein [Hordeum vulgare]|nr:AP2-containing protein [Hordeum vulgare]
MAPRRRPSFDFFGVRERPSGRFAAEITADGVRWWIGTFNSAELAARAYDAAAIRFGRPRRALNFPDTEREYALWLAPPMHFVDVTDGHEQRRQQWRERRRSTSSAWRRSAATTPSSCRRSSTSSPGGRRRRPLPPPAHILG